MATKLDPYIPYDISQLWARQNPDATNPAGVNPGAMLADEQSPDFANVRADQGVRSDVPGSTLSALDASGSASPVPVGVNPGAMSYPGGTPTPSYPIGFHKPEQWPGANSAVETARSGIFNQPAIPPSFANVNNSSPPTKNSPEQQSLLDSIDSNITSAASADRPVVQAPTQDQINADTASRMGYTRRTMYSGGAPIMPGMPDPRPIFTGRSKDGSMSFSDNPAFMEARGDRGMPASPHTAALAASDASDVAEGRRQGNLAVQNQQRVMAYNQAPKTAEEVTARMGAQATATKIAADVASTQAATEATRQGTQVAAAKAKEELAAKDRLTQAAAAADAAVPGSGPRAAALAHVASGGDANDPNALDIVRQGDTGLKTEIANFINNGTKPLGTNGAFNPFNHEGNIVNPAAMNLSDIKMGRSFGKRTMTVTDSAGKEKTVFLDYGDNSLSPQLQSYLLSQQTNAASRAAATPRKSP